MHKLTTAEKGQIHLNQCPKAVRNYVAALELELERVTTRQYRLRQNVRSMQKKLELVTLKDKLNKLVRL